MIKIGDFARLFNISIKAVRFYEEKGLIHPKEVDIYTGYRYYDDNNIDEMSKVLFLKNLGLSIKEIRDFDEKEINSKIEEYEDNIKKISQDINILRYLSNNEERRDDIMKTFINDENAIGKWRLSKIVKTKEDYNSDAQSITDDWNIDEIYLMPNGEKYWVISWTKGFIFINDRPYSYEIDGNLLFIKYADNIAPDDYVYVVYERIDNKEYTISDIEHIDDTNVPFVKDDTLVGFWNVIDVVHSPDSFNPKHLGNRNRLYLEKLTVMPDGEVNVTFDGKIKKASYTKDYIINLLFKDTMSKYIINEIDGHTYMIVEWKSGDYVHGGIIPCYYVLEKMK